MSYAEHIIASGPVIVRDGKVLLNRQIRGNNVPSPFFMFPGGKISSMDEDPREACIREAKEEMGIDIKILRPLETLIVKRPDAPGEYAILISYLADFEGEPNPPEDVTIDWIWAPIDDLPKNCTENVFEVLNRYNAE